MQKLIVLAFFHETCGVVSGSNGEHIITVPLNDALSQRRKRVTDKKNSFKKKEIFKTT